MLFTFLAAISGFLAVAFGAFGAHALKSRLGEYELGIWQTAVQYHFWHTLALLLVGVLIHTGMQQGVLRAGGWLFVAGTVIFSGSLYALALSGVKVLGAVTPLGGLLLLGGWACLVVAAWHNMNSAL